MEEEKIIVPDLSTFIYPQEEVVFIGALVAKKWGKNKDIICYIYDSENDIGYRLHAYWKPELEKSYMIGKSSVRATELELGSVLMCTCGYTRTRKVAWRGCKVLGVMDDYETR